MHAKLIHVVGLAIGVSVTEETATMLPTIQHTQWNNIAVLVIENRVDHVNVSCIQCTL